jgi:hypothetical protein
MKISTATLNKAVDAKIITAKQATALISFIKNQPNQEPNFNLSNVLYYFGGLIAIGAMTLFMNLGWERFGPWGVFCLSIIYAIIGLWLAREFQRREYNIPAGICATFVVALTPLAIYAFQQAMGLWPDSTPYRDYHYYIKWHWIYMELGTLAVGIVLAWIYRYPFMVMPIAVTLWYMSMDVAYMLTRDAPDYQFSAMVSMYFGLVTILIAFWVDLRAGKAGDYAFWLYIFGVMAFWGGLSSQSSDSELSKFIYLCINLSMIGVGVMLMRRVFVIFGALGCSFYLGHLASEVFEDSMLFPIALTVIGLLIIYLGTLWQKHEAAITNKVQSILPKPFRELLQSRDDN